MILPEHFGDHIMGVIVGLYTNDIYVSFAGIAGSLMALGQVKVLHRRTDLTMSAVYATGAMAMVGLICYLITGLELSELVTLLLFCVGNGFLTLVLAQSRRCGRAPMLKMRCHRRSARTSR